MKSKKFFLTRKGLFLIAFLVVYFSALTVISHARYNAIAAVEQKDVTELVLNEAEEDNSVDYLPQMTCSRSEMRAENGVLVQDGDVLFGPYIKVSQGEYRLIVRILGTTEPELTITSSSGQTVLGKYTLHDGENEIFLTFDKDYAEVEFVFYGTQERGFSVTEVRFGEK